MKGRRRLRDKLAREARSSEQRLRDAVAPNFSGPVLGRANIVYEMAERTRGTAHGGTGLVTKLVKTVGLAKEVDSSLQLLKLQRPYHEPNLAFNALCGGQRLDDIELRRRDQVFLDGTGAASLPGPTTAGDFCQRFDETSIMALQEAVNRARLKVWANQPPEFFAQTAKIDADASLVVTDGECKQGMDISYSAQPVVMCRLARNTPVLRWFSAARPVHNQSPSRKARSWSGGR